jgi:hypothetical protein
MATATKDMWVANLVDSWRGDSNSISVYEFFETIEEAAEMGTLTSKDKIRLARLKLKGAARAFYSAQPQLKADDVTFEVFRLAFVNRFKDKHTDQFNYARMQNAAQEKNESPEMFLDRLRKLCQRTVQVSENPVEQGIISREADRRLLAAFINGLTGVPGRQVRLLMPETIDKALNMAITATTADKEDRAVVREDRGMTRHVFAVGETRERENVQWSQYRGDRHYRGAGHSTRGRGVNGTRSSRTDSRTPVGSAQFLPTGGGAASGPKNGDDRYAQRPQGIQCYNCGLTGHISRMCRGQNRRLNGIGRTNMAPSSNPK